MCLFVQFQIKIGQNMSRIGVQCGESDRRGSGVVTGYDLISTMQNPDVEWFWR